MTVTPLEIAMTCLIILEHAIDQPEGEFAKALDEFRDENGSIQTREAIFNLSTSIESAWELCMEKLEREERSFGDEMAVAVGDFDFVTVPKLLEQIADYMDLFTDHPTMPTHIYRVLMDFIKVPDTADINQ